ncbi:hypothetical protein MCEGE14_02135 [Burkholderiaceae bacterium]
MGIGKRTAVQRVFGVGASGANISALKSCIDIAASGTQVARKTAEMKKPNIGVGRSHSLIWLPTLDLNQGPAGLTGRFIF